MSKNKRWLKFGILLLLFLLLIGAAILGGSVVIPAADIMDFLMGREIAYQGILVDIRIPRILMAILIGANLSTAGVLLQSVMQNPMADAGVTGISSGASVAVVFLMLYMPRATPYIPLIGFLGGAVACVLVYILAWNKGISAIRIILSGIAINAVLGGINGMMNIVNSDKLAGVLTWLNGSMSGESMQSVRTCFLYTVFGLVAAVLLATNCNILALGDKNARTLGYNPNMQRLLISLVGVYLAGISTSFVGIIGFLGLMAPHIARLLIGTNHKYLLPFSMLLGSTVLLLADTLGRTIFSPYEIPAGIMMAVFGAPFFLVLLRKGGKAYGH